MLMELFAHIMSVRSDRFSSLEARLVGKVSSTVLLDEDK